MNALNGHQLDSNNSAGASQPPAVGETLPLFDTTVPPSLAQTDKVGDKANLSGKPRQSGVHKAIADDPHMQTAWEIAKALQENARQTNTVRKHAGRSASKLSPVQRHKAGNAICEHLLASLREQVVSEARQGHGGAQLRAANDANPTQQVLRIHH